MSEAFEKCVKAKGRVRRINPKEGVYLNICYKNGKSYRGEIHHTEKKDNKYSSSLKS